MKNNLIKITLTVLVLLISSGVTVSIAEHHSTMLVHMEGNGPTGKYLEDYKVQTACCDTNAKINSGTQVENSNQENNTGEQEVDHHVGEIGKEPHGGTIEEADLNHMEIASSQQ